MEALVLAKKGAQSFPSFELDFTLLLAEVYLEQGGRRRARELLERVLNQHPSFEPAQRMLARIPA
ncbi:MAG: tetratricopeptide repeat protein [Myxococcaceae bacterium]|nr:tetratricopeptide repeat protein [Myxococcaceae bacterium]